MTHTVFVPQSDGEVVITPGGGGEPRVYPVSDNLVEVEAADLATFLTNVDGSELADFPEHEPDVTPDPAAQEADNAGGQPAEQSGPQEAK